MKFSKNKFTANKGFALVVTLSLMILLTLLAVGLLSLSSIALRTSTAGEAQARAYANARMALFIAIGELQKHAGDDKRITADASILRETPEAQDHLVGVWKSWSPKYSISPIEPAPGEGGDRPPNYDREKNEGFVSWLASSEDLTAVTEQDWPETTGPGNDWPKLFSLANDGFDLQAAPIDLMPPATPTAPAGGVRPNGSYAWAVAQENTKAKINIAGPDVAPIPTSNVALQVQPRPSLALATGLTQPADGWDIRASRVISMNQAKLDEAMVSDPVAFAAAAASYTVHAMGLLTDPIRGGFKTDLSLGFELEDSDFEETSWNGIPNPFRTPLTGDFALDSPTSFRGEQPLFLPLVENPIVSRVTDYDVATVTQNFNGAGVPTFDHLRSFYRIPHHLYGGSSPIVAERGADHVAIRLTPASGSTYPPPSSPPTGLKSTLAIRPVLNRMIYILSPSLRTVATPQGPRERLHITITPVISLWNPYNIALEIRGAIAYPWMDIPFNLIWDVGNGDVDPNYMSNQMGNQFLDIVTPAKSAGRSVDPYFLCVLTKEGDGKLDELILLQPGEVRVFSPKNPDPIPFLLGAKNDKKDLNTKIIHMRPATEDPNTLNLTGGLRVPMTENLNRLDITGSAVSLTVKPTDPSTSPSGFYYYFVTLEDVTRIEDQDIAGRDIMISGQTITDVQLRNLAGQIPKTTFSVNELRNGSPIIGALETYQQLSRKTSDAQPAALVYTNNPRQAYFNESLAALSNPGFSEPAPIPSFISSLRRFSSINGAIEMDGGKSFWGNSFESGGQTVMPFFEIPREPMLSLAGFQHADLASNAFTQAHQFANSFASAYLARSNVAIEGGDGDARPEVPLYDHSYLTNEALWDRFFFSGAAPIMTPSGMRQIGHPSVAWNVSIADATRPLSQVVRDFVQDPSGSPLSNERMELHRGGLSDQDLTDKLLAPEGCTLIAAHLMVDGAFNINSTDVAAWTAVLAGIRGQPFAIQDGVAAAPQNRTAFPRFRHPSGVANEVWDTFRSLEDSQVRTLAEEIVKEVRLRGPFQSLAEFVNRRVADTELGSFGAIQAAINSSGLNEGDVLQDDFDASTFPGDAQGHIITKTGVGLPGYLTQADVLQSLAPVITCRSDTFIVRGYGEAKDANGRVIARARCEAVVQRMPEFVDSTVAATTAIADAGIVNQKFGRRFEIVSYRRVSNSEIQ